jgi:hypothetical protein
MANTDTTISTDPDTLRAEGMEPMSPAVQKAMQRFHDRAAEIDAIAAEKEAQAAPPEDLRKEVQIAFEAVGRRYWTDDQYEPGPYDHADAALTAIAAAGYEIRPRGGATEPAAWSYERARMFFADGSPAEWGATMFSRSPPHDPPDTIRNLTPLYRWPRAYTAGESLGSELVAAPEEPTDEMVEAASEAGAQVRAEIRARERTYRPGIADSEWLPQAIAAAIAALIRGRR